MEKKLRVVISGGGLAGATIANALLLDAPNIDVQLYESAPEFSESGAAIGLAVNAQRALAKIFPCAEDLLQRAGAVRNHSSRAHIGSGTHAGRYISDLADEQQKQPGQVVHRATLLKELLAPIPASRLHANKKLVDIKEEAQDKSLELHFEDGEVVPADVLIGADGIFGFVRSWVLGKDHPATKAVPAGWAGVQTLVPTNKAREKLDAKWFEEPRQYAWFGRDGFIMHNMLSNGQLYQCVATHTDWEPSNADSRQRLVDRTLADKLWGDDWLKQGPIAKGILDILLDKPEPASAWVQYHHRDAPTYVKHRVCIAGDAAHAMTPWQGSGGGCAIEDAVVLGALLRHCFSVKKQSKEQQQPLHIDAALHAYDAVRRPRTQYISASSYRTGLMITGQVPEIGLDPDKLRAAMQNRWDFIYKFDLDAHVQQALDVMDAEIKKLSI